MNRRKLGHFHIPDDVLESGSNLIQKVMSRVIIVRCEHLYGRQGFEYVAICEDFDEVPLGSALPTYNIIVHNQQDSEPLIEFKKID